jgi:hypothetical protein
VERRLISEQEAEEEEEKEEEAEAEDYPVMAEADDAWARWTGRMKEPKKVARAL